MSVYDVNPNVWTDSVGRWHASVPISASRNEDARAARKLIRDAQIEMGTANNRPIRITRIRITSHGTVIYGEV